MQVLLGALNISLGILFLFIPIIFIELGRPKDILKACLLLLLGISLFLTSNNFNRDDFLIYVCNSLLIFLFAFEVLLNRWYQLCEKEKEELKSLSNLGSKFLLFVSALKLSFQKICANLLPNFKENNLPIKKWVRPEKESNTKDLADLKYKSPPMMVEKTNTTKKDIIEK